MLTINLNKFGSAQFALCLIQMIVVESSIVRFDDKLGKSKIQSMLKFMQKIHLSDSEDQRQRYPRSIIRSNNINVY